MCHAQNCIDKRLARVHGMYCMHTQITGFLIGNNAVNRLDQPAVSTRTLLELRNTPSESYYILLVCPSCRRSAWTRLRKRGVSRESLLNTVWEFQCPVHGLLREKPLQAGEEFALPWAPE